MTDFSSPGYPATPPVASSGKSGKGKKESKPTKRSASTAKILFLALAGLAALFVILLLTSRDKPAYVVRSTAALPALVEINKSSVEAAAIPESAVEPDTFSGASADEALLKFNEYVTDKWLVYPIGAKAQLRTTDFTTTGALSTPLLPDERLISVSAKAARAVSGSIKAGDHVDVYTSVTENGLTGVLARNVEVAGVSLSPDSLDGAAQAQVGEKDKTLSDYVPGEPIPGTYVIRVKADRVPLFVAADTAGQLFLAMRSPDAKDVEGGQPADVIDAICGETPTAPACARSATN